LTFYRPVAAEEAVSGFLIYFNVSDAGTILPTIVLFFHQNVHLINGERGAIFIDVIGKWFAQANEGNAAFMKDGITHKFEISVRPLLAAIIWLISSY
jgi:hypothetical protein